MKFILCIFAFTGFIACTGKAKPSVVANDQSAPSVSFSPVPGGTVSNLSQVTLTFSEKIKHAEDLGSYSISGSGIGSLTISSVSKISDLQFNLLLTGTPGNGAVFISLTGITDIAGNALSGTGVSYTADTQGLTVSTMPVSGSAFSTVSSITLQFSRVPTGAGTAANYAITGAGAGSLTISSVTVLSSTSYRLNLSGTAGNGAVNVLISNITDQNGTALQGTTQSFLADTTTPLITANPVTGSSVSSLATLDLTFNEAVNGAGTPANYVVSGSGAGTLSVNSVTWYSGNTYRLSFSGAPAAGTVLLSLSGISDLAGNSYTSGSLSFNIDTTSPIMTATPADTSIIRSIASVDFTFSKPVTGATVLGNYLLSGSGIGTLTKSSVISLGGNSYRLALSGSPGNGSLFIFANNITDTSGNPLIANRVQYTTDVSAPAVLNIAPQPGFFVTIQSLPYVDVTFTEPVVNATNLANYSLTGGVTITSVTSLGGNTYRLGTTGTIASGTLSLQISGIRDAAGNTSFSYIDYYNIVTTVPTVAATPASGSTIISPGFVDLVFSTTMNAATANPANYVISGSGAGTLGVSSVVALATNRYRLIFSGMAASGNITLTMNNLADFRGNALTANTLTYACDSAAPTQTSSPANLAYLQTFGNVDISYSEIVTGATTAANYTLYGSGKGTLAIAGVASLGGNNYRLTFSGTKAEGPLQILIANVRDNAGNFLNGNALNYTLDTIAPTLTSTPAEGTTLQVLPQLDIVFSEQVTGALTLANYALSGPGQGTLVLVSVTALTDTSVRLVFTGTPVNGNIQVTLSNLADLAALPLANPVVTLLGDFTGPVVVNAYPAIAATGVGVDRAIQLVFAEKLDPATVTSSTFQLKQGATVMPGSLTLLENHIIFQPTGNLGALTTYTINTTTGIKDLVGNTASAYTAAFTTGTAQSLAVVSNVPSQPKDMVDLNGVVYFSAYLSGNGRNPWRSDGTAGGTSLMSIYVGYPWITGSDPKQFTRSGNYVYFEAYTDTYAGEVWRANGSGASLFTDTSPGINGGFPKNLFDANGNFVATGYTGDGYERVYVNGSLLITACYSCGSPGYYAMMGGLLFFTIGTDGNGAKLYRSDLTPAGTWMVAPPGANTGGGFINTAAAGTQLFGSAYLSATGYELWKSDGATAAGTLMVKDINPGVNSSAPSNITALGNNVIFTADDGVHGIEVWVSDGTEAGTTLLKDIKPGNTTSNARNFFNAFGKVYFNANDGTNGSCLWVTDGTSAGTKIVKKIEHWNWAASGGLVYLIANNSSFGSEIWQTDGTADGTLLVSDKVAGVGGYAYGPLVKSGSYLYFAGSSGTYLSRMIP